MCNLKKFYDENVGVIKNRVKGTKLDREPFYPYNPIQRREMAKGGTEFNIQHEYVGSMDNNFNMAPVATSPISVRKQINRQPPQQKQRTAQRVQPVKDNIPLPPQQRNVTPNLPLPNGNYMNEIALLKQENEELLEENTRLGKELESQEEVVKSVATLESERNFYYLKLLAIEELLKANGNTENDGTVEGKILYLLYKDDEDPQAIAKQAIIEYNLNNVKHPSVIKQPSEQPVNNPKVPPNPETPEEDDYYDENPQIVEEIDLQNPEYYDSEDEDNPPPVNNMKKTDKKEDNNEEEYDENGKPIYYDDYGNPMTYDENGQILYYDENGDYVFYDVNGNLQPYQPS